MTSPSTCPIVTRLQAELATAKRLNTILEHEKQSLRHKVKAAYRRMQLAQDELRSLRGDLRNNGEYQKNVNLIIDNASTISYSETSASRVTVPCSTSSGQNSGEVSHE